MNKKWKIGIVYDTSKKSKGHHGTHLAFTGLPDVELILVDSNTNELKRKMEEIGANKHYDHYKEMILNEQPDIVCVCSRLPDEHFEVVKTAIENRCHVLCEKPLSSSLQEADEIAGLAEKYNVKVAVAHLARYALVFRTMKQMIEDGDIGTPLFFYGRGKEDERGGGEDMTVLGTHILDIANFMFGKPECVSAEVKTDNRFITRNDRCITTEPVGICAGDSIKANFKFTNNVRGVFESHKGRYTGTVRMGVTVIGTEGILSVRYDMERKLQICRSPFHAETKAFYEEVELKESRVIPEGTVPLNYNLYGAPEQYFGDNNRFAALDLMDAITENRQPASNVYDAINVLEIIYAVYASSLERETINLPLINRVHPLER